MHILQVLAGMVLMVVVVVIAAVVSRPVTSSFEDKGPMPKLHGGYSQKSNSGKS